MTAVQVRELLQAFGTLKAFNLVTDRDTGASKVRVQPMVNPGCVRTVGAQMFQDKDTRVQASKSS